MRFDNPDEPFDKCFLPGLVKGAVLFYLDKYTSQFNKQINKTAPFFQRSLNDRKEGLKTKESAVRQAQSEGQCLLGRGEMDLPSPHKLSRFRYESLCNFFEGLPSRG